MKFTGYITNAGNVDRKPHMVKLRVRGVDGTELYTTLDKRTVAGRVPNRLREMVSGDGNRITYVFTLDESGHITAFEPA